MSMLGWCSTGHHGYTDSSEPGLCPGKVKGSGGRVLQCDCDCHTNPKFRRPRIIRVAGPGMAGDPDELGVPA